MTNNITVIKRDQTSEQLDLEKMHKVVFYACEGITGVS
jgi:ribonucleoside-diphosphate reductase alpha chain